MFPRKYFPQSYFDKSYFPDRTVAAAAPQQSGQKMIDEDLHGVPDSAAGRRRQGMPWWLKYRRWGKP